MSEACTYYTELMSLVIDGQSSEEEDKQLLHHVLHCSQCRSELAQLWEMHQTFSNWEEQEIPAGIAQRVMERIRTEEAAAVVPSTAPKRLQTNAKILPFWKPLISVAACAAVCVGLWRFTAPSAQTPSAPTASQASYTTASSSTTTSLPIPKTLTSEPASAQSESGLSDTSEITAMVSDVLGKTPGTILVLEEIPVALKGSRHTTQNGNVILVPETEDITELLTQLPSPLMEISGTEGPVVLLVLK